MQEVKTYREYAEVCRRLARTMKPEDAPVLLKMAEAWDERAQAAESVAQRSEAKKDGDGRAKD